MLGVALKSLPKSQPKVIQLSEISDDPFLSYYENVLKPKLQKTSFNRPQTLADRSAYLQIACRPSITELNISCRNLTDGFLELLQSLNLKLIGLNVSGCLNMTPEAILRFTKATPSLKVLILDRAHRKKWEQLKK